MPTVTLQDIKATQDKLAEMIASLEAKSAAPKVYTVREAMIELAAGERYAGLLLDSEGAPSHHLVLLPGEAQDVNWTDAKAWAAKAGGELPTRAEQALLYANLKGEFEATWYWSGQEHESDGSYAWYQYFDYGYQYLTHKGNEGRARAVRRFAA